MNGGPHESRSQTHQTVPGIAYMARGGSHFVKEGRVVMTFCSFSIMAYTRALSVNSPSTLCFSGWHPTGLSRELQGPQLIDQLELAYMPNRYAITLP